MKNATQLTADQIEVIEGSVPDLRNITCYSGRSMYGAYCLGIDLDDWSDVMLFIVNVTAQDYDLGFLLADKLTYDSMGMGIIIYWPGIAFDGFTDYDIEG